MIKKSVYGVLGVVLFFILTSCGSGSSSAPAGSKITILPPDGISRTNSGSEQETTREDFTITVTNANDVPLNDVEIWISFPFAVPHGSAYAQLYDGSVKKESPMKVKTDENGVYYLRFEYESGNNISFTGALQVTSGSSSASVPVTVASSSSS